MFLACVASVSNRVIARKLEREQKNKQANKLNPLPLPRHSLFLTALVPTFSTNSRGNAWYASYHVLWCFPDGYSLLDSWSSICKNAPFRILVRSFYGTTEESGLKIALTQATLLQVCEVSQLLSWRKSTSWCSETTNGASGTALERAQAERKWSRQRSPRGQGQ